jgi:hypothetical protein
MEKVISTIILLTSVIIYVKATLTLIEFYANNKNISTTFEILLTQILLAIQML